MTGMRIGEADMERPEGVTADDVGGTISIGESPVQVQPSAPPEDQMPTALELMEIDDGSQLSSLAPGGQAPHASHKSPASPHRSENRDRPQGSPRTSARVSRSSVQVDDGGFAVRTTRPRSNARTSAPSQPAPTSLWGRVKAGLSKLGKAVSNMFKQALALHMSLVSGGKPGPLDLMMTGLVFFPAVVGAAVGSAIKNAVMPSRDTSNRV
jgi:hypothetical protein